MSRGLPQGEEETELLFNPVICLFRVVWSSELQSVCKAGCSSGNDSAVGVSPKTNSVVILNQEHAFSTPHSSELEKPYLQNLQKRTEYVSGYMSQTFVE